MKKCFLLFLACYMTSAWGMEHASTISFSSHQVTAACAIQKAFRAYKDRKIREIKTLINQAVELTEQLEQQIQEIRQYQAARKADLQLLTLWLHLKFPGYSRS